MKIELEIAQMWEEILGIHPVGVTDNFFEVGGHSLLAGRLLAKVQERFHVNVSRRAFFAAATVTGLATAVVNQLVECADAGTMTRTLEELRELSDKEARRLSEAGN